MKYRLPLILFSLLIPVFFLSQTALADVPFPGSGTVTAATSDEIPTETVSKTSLPMDPTLFAALTGIAGMLIGSLITLTGAYASSKMRTEKCKNKPMDIQPDLQ